MSEKRFPPSSAFAANAHINATKYAEMYATSIADTDAFWHEHGKRIDWIKPFQSPKMSVMPILMSRSNGLKTGC